jgi:hypothetical protein
MAKVAQADLFPWILGFLLIVGAIPAVVALTETIEKPAPVAVAAPAPRSAVSAAAVPLATQPKASVAATQPTKPPPLPAGQVWQCVINGQRTFSDSPCGAGASIRQLNAVNGMEGAVPAPNYPYPAYGPSAGYDPRSGYTPAPGYDPDSQGQDAPIEGVYGSNQLLVLEERRRREHHAPPRFHSHPAAHAGSTR